MALIVLDGWGIAPAWGGNAISQARTKIFDKLFQSCPSTTLLASGEAVGLPINSPGNSEAGHLNIGAGRVVHQDITLIDQKISDDTFFSNNVLRGSVSHAQKYNSSIHLLGLLSDTGIHSHVRHLYALLEFYKKQQFSRVFLHLFSDGRDSDPMHGIELISQVEEKIKEIGVGKIASISGRFFAMDRDNRWGRVAIAYDSLVLGKGEIASSTRTAFSSSYSLNQTDEFITPRLIVNETQQKTIITDNDAIIFFNFRPDRTRELTKAFLADSLPEMRERKKLKNLYFASFALSDENGGALEIFKPESITNPLAKIISDKGLSQFHTAETEKYPHITYFINGGTEKPFPGEYRMLIPSPRSIKTYDEKPEMSAKELTATILNALRKNCYDFYFINFANADMVGHTGNLEATVAAVEFVDECLGQVLDKIFSLNGTALIVGDHGNAEQMVNPRTGSPDTEHTTNPVPFIVASGNPEIQKIKLGSGGILASVSPTMLDLVNIEKPEQMVNQTLLISEKALNAQL